MKIDRKIRRSQYINPFGVGAILDIGQESFIAEDIAKWRPEGMGDKISLKRLSTRLRVEEFRMPPSPKDFESYTKKLPFSRFPQWLFCSSCDDLIEWKTNKPQNEPPKCTKPQCSGTVLTPMRFVMACRNGHLSDVDWHRWAHSKQDITGDGRCDVKDQLKYRSRNKSFGGGLGSLEIHCEACGASRSLEGITAKDAMKSIGKKCENKQPWEFLPPAEFNKCDETPLVIQKGASNVYFPKIISALDIPLNENTYKDNEGAYERLKEHGYFEEYKTSLKEEDPNGQSVFLKRLVRHTGLSEDEIKKIAKAEISQVVDDDKQNEIAIEEKEILIEEWPVLIETSQNKGTNYESKEENFGDIENFGLNDLFAKLILIPKLREVRVLRGFNRIEPKDKDFIAADLDKKKPWLPAIEVFGEGIFIQFSEKAIEAWQTNSKEFITNRIEPIHNQYKKKDVSFLTSQPTARYIMIHTFAHLLIRQLSFECGYSASSLRERIYSNDGYNGENPMAGILIYTADSDSEGALGGLVRQGKKDRFVSTIMAALERGSWCSSDPVCKELDGQGMMGLNRAACHACCLISETSCVNHNIFLDRILAIGDGEDSFGFFSDAIKAFRAYQK